MQRHRQVPRFSSPQQTLDSQIASEASITLGQPDLISDFDAFETEDGPVSLARSWLAADEAGVASLVVGQASGKGMVRVYSWASHLQGQSRMYVRSSHQHQAPAFAATLSFTPFEGPVAVVTTSTPSGADLVIAGREGGHSVARVHTAARSTAVPTQLAAQSGRTLVRSQGALAVAGG